MQLLVLATAVLAWGCSGVGYEKTKTGMEYKIFSDGKGKQIKVGDFVKFNYRITYNDSTVATSYDFIPGYDQVDSVPRYHDFSEISTKLRVGDSVICIMLYDSLATRNQLSLPPYFKKGTKQKMTLKVLGIVEGGREMAMQDYQKELEKFKDLEMAQIERYLTDKKIKAEKVNNVVWVEVQEQGTGPKADSGKYVGVKYTGTLLESGKAFDSNIDSSKQSFKHDMAPFYFTAMQQGAISGMLQGITKFNQGGRGRMFIPSLLGYGPQGNPPAIGPNQKLIFDIQVVDVKDSTPRPPQSPEMSALDILRKEGQKQREANEKQKNADPDVRSKRLPKNQ
jgi:FKBP-type peptidyl-prolyl cis-trans isomerase FkpA